jgi:hypothetical protein
MHVTNGNHHYRFERDGKLVEWWPNTSKAVLNKKWDDPRYIMSEEEMKEKLGLLFPEIPIDLQAPCPFEPNKHD